MTRQEWLLAHMENDVEAMLGRIRQDGAILREDGFTDTRFSGFCVSKMLTCFVHPASRFAVMPARARLRDGIDRVLTYLEAAARPSGMFDLSSCNFDSAPDTAFTVNALLDSAHLLKASTMPDAAPVLERLLPILLRAADGICEGGFHTPNHRWAIAACLMDTAGFARSDEQAERYRIASRRYLAEGLDISEDGEFAERSSGTYNAVNDDQMLRLFLTTKDRQYLEAARRNLTMMLSYFEPDGSIFTQHSTRQDQGKRMWPVGYFWLYAMCGYLSKDSAFAGYARFMWDTVTSHGAVPEGLAWLMRFPELESFLESGTPDLGRITRYTHQFVHSGICRWRENSFSVSILAGKPDFLYIQSGEVNLCVSLYANVCDKRNFRSEGIEAISETHVRLHCTFDSWYYLPYEPGENTTSDWWEMDNASTRSRQVRDSLQVIIDLVRDADGHGLQMELAANGLSHVPMRLELGCLGKEIRSETFVMPCLPGNSLTMLSGNLQISDGKGGVLSVSPCFGSHNVLSVMGGAFQQSDARTVVNLTCESPCTHSVHISDTPLYPPEYCSQQA